MSLGTPKIQPPAPAPAPVATGADALKLGGADDTSLLGRGVVGLGRLKLRNLGSTPAAASSSTAVSAPASVAAGVAPSPAPTRDVSSGSSSSSSLRVGRGAASY